MAAETTRRCKVLMVDDDALRMTPVAEWLRTCGSIVTLVPDASAALALLRDEAQSYDVAVVDIQLPFGAQPTVAEQLKRNLYSHRVGGLWFIEQLRKLRPNLPVVVFSVRERASAEADGRSLGIDVEALGIHRWLVKPSQPGELEAAVRNAIRKTP